eukprot:191786-Pleurochrysis_carterae.AAC.1
MTHLQNIMGERGGEWAGERGGEWAGERGARATHSPCAATASIEVPPPTRFGARRLSLTRPARSSASRTSHRSLACKVGAAAKQGGGA